MASSRTRRSRPRCAIYLRGLAGLAGLALLGLSACDFACTEIACDRDGLRVSATRADGHPLADGVYEIELAADADVYRATCSLQELAQGDCEFQSLDEDPYQDAWVTVAGDDVPRDIRIDVRRAELTATSIDLTGPTTVTLAIALDGITIATEDLSPTYERDEPNGPECGACEHSEYIVDLLPPTANP